MTVRRSAPIGSSFVMLLFAATGCGSASPPSPENEHSVLDAGSSGSTGVDASAHDAGDSTGSSFDAAASHDAAPTDSSQGGSGQEDSGNRPISTADASPDAERDASPQTNGLWVMGYYSGWDARNLPVAQIPWADLTHIATAFMIPNGTGGFTSASDPNDPSFDPTLAQSVISAAHAAGKKAIASIGGADSSSAFEASTTSTTMGPFVASLKALVTNTGYDGIDIDWEGGPTSDDALLLSLVMNLRAALPTATITMTAGIINDNQKPTDLATLYAAAAPSVDQINLMTYGMAGAYQGWKSWHSSPLHWNQDDTTPTGIDNTVSAYIAAGVPAKKLGIGSGFYGECYTSPVTMPDQALGGSTVAASDGIGNLSYRDIVTTYLPIGTRQWDTGAMVPYLSITASNPYDCTYVTYEDAQSIAAKGTWAKSSGLGGAIIWTINEGYVPGGDAGTNPVLDAMGAAFLR